MAHTAQGAIFPLMCYHQASYDIHTLSLCDLCPRPSGYNKFHDFILKHFLFTLLNSYLIHHFCNSAQDFGLFKVPLTCHFSCVSFVFYGLLWASPNASQLCDGHTLLHTDHWNSPTHTHECKKKKKTCFLKFL